MLSRLLTNCVVTLTVIVLLHSIASGQIDWGVPDTTYFAEPAYDISTCQPTVDHILQFKVFTDGGPGGMSFQFAWTPPAVFLDLAFGAIFLEEGTYHYSSIDSSNHSGYVSVDAGDNGTFDWGLPPSTQTLCTIRFRSHPGDSFSVSIVDPGVDFIGFTHGWRPTVTQNAIELASPDSIPLSPGDANCSGDVTISDVVQLLQYIFGGGSASYDLNAADPDSSCSITISDAVYLIQYIFQGGPPPNQGCVVP